MPFQTKILGVLMKTIIVYKHDIETNVFKWIEDNVYRIRLENNDPTFRFTQLTINEELAKIDAKMYVEDRYLKIVFNSDKFYTWFLLTYGAKS